MTRLCGLMEESDLGSRAWQPGQRTFCFQCYELYWGATPGLVHPGETIVVADQLRPASCRRQRGGSLVHCVWCCDVVK